jgi:UDP-N-acetylmuramoylalanine--D-glutamate ligase
MEPFGEYHGIKFYNDAIATIPHAVECAVEALDDVDTLIFGGMDRGIDYSEFVNYLEKCKLRNIIGMPDTGFDICNALLERGCTKNIIIANNMEEAVDAAFRFTEKGKSCIMSPAASSYNVYKDFEHKGNHYKELVRAWNG